MARYIDADALLSKLPNDLPYKASVKRVLMQAPTADVVPKSEVKKCALIHEYIHEKILENCDYETKEAYEKAYNTELSRLADTIIIKSEVEKIFEEIEEHRDKIHGIVLLLPEELAELKKKYTEENK